MFGYNNSISDDIDSLDNLLLDTMRTAALSDMSVPFQCFFEAAIPPNLTNNPIFNVVTDKLMNSIHLIYKNLETVTNSTITFVTEKTRYMTDLYERYKQRIEDASETAFSNIMYQNISFIIEERIPAKIDTNSVNKYISALDSSVITRDDVKKMKSTLFDYSIKNARGDILASKRPMSAREFDDAYRLVFKNDALVIDTSLTKSDVLKLYPKILSYDKTITNIKRSFDIVKNIFSIYGKHLEHILNSRYKSHTDKTKTKEDRTDIIAVATYNEYKSILIKYIMTILDMYSTVYQYKVTTFRAMVTHDSNTLKSVIASIQQTPFIETSIGRLNFSQQMISNFQKKQYIDLSSLTEVIITKDNLEEIKKKYKNDFRFRFKFSVRDDQVEIYWYKGNEILAEAIVDISNKDKITLEHLGVNPKYQGSGLSKQILDRVVPKYKIKYLEVFEDGEVAASIYTKYGFKEYKREDGVIFMKLD